MKTRGAAYNSTPYEFKKLEKGIQEGRKEPPSPSQQSSNPVIMSIQAVKNSGLGDCVACKQPRQQESGAGDDVSLKELRQLPFYSHRLLIVHIKAYKLFIIGVPFPTSSPLDCH